MKERKRFLLYYDWENLIKDMSDSDIASLTRGIFKYQNTGEISDMTYGAKLAFSFMRPVFDEDKKDWEVIREKRVVAGREGGKSKQDNIKQIVANASKGVANASKGVANASKGVANASKTYQDLPVIDIDSVSGIVIANDITETVSKDTGQQAVEVFEKKELIDNRNSGTQRVIDIIKNQVEQEGYLYDNNKEERNRATIIAKRQSDWGLFIKDSPEEREEEIIRSIITYSNKNEYSAKIRSVKDFHEKWKKVANDMKQKAIKQEKTNFIPKF